MTKESDRHSDTDTEAGSLQSNRAGKFGAIMCPTVCALLLVCIFAVSFIGTKLAYKYYDVLCSGSPLAKLYVFRNVTLMRVSQTHREHSS